MAFYKFPVGLRDLTTGCKLSEPGFIGLRD